MYNVNEGEVSAVSSDKDGTLFSAFGGASISGNGEVVAFNYVNGDSMGVVVIETDSMSSSIINNNVSTYYQRTSLFNPAVNNDGSIIVYSSKTRDLGDTAGDFTLPYIATTDADGDGLIDIEEYYLGTAPTSQDTDGDGLDDFNDAFPTDSSEWADTDGDGIGDNSELPVRADVNGKKDLFWRNPELLGGYNRVFLMDGAGKVSRWSNTLGNLTIEGIGDFNGDRVKELILRNGQSLKVWSLAEGATSFEETALDALAPSDWILAGTGDLDGDGTEDLIWRNIQDGRNSVYYMEEGVVREQKLLPQVGTTWSLAKVEDSNGDRKVDFLWRNETLGGRNIVHLMDGTNRIAASVLKTVGGTWFMAD